MKKIILQIFLLFVVNFLIACSSSSGSQRYGINKEKEVDIDNSVRFSSNNNKEEINILDEEFDEKPPVTNPKLKNQLKESVQKFSDFSPELTNRETILFEIIKYIDTPYKYGGIDFNGIDCSAFTQNVYSKSAFFDLPRTASQQFKIGEKIKDKDELEFGDLVFFNTTKRSYPGHVGIYVGENLFAHASRTLGVTISSLNENYYIKRFVGARRVK